MLQLFQQVAELLSGKKFEEGGSTSAPPDGYKIQLESWYCTVSEDDYEKGEGAYVNGYGNKEMKAFDSADDFFDYINNHVTFKIDAKKEDFTAFEDEDGRITYSVLVDSDVLPATKNEIDDWKKKEVKLYSARYDLYVTFVKRYEPTVDEMVKVFGIPKYEKGGMFKRPKSAINRDRKYISQEEHEQNYKRKTKGKHYNN